MPTSIAINDLQLIKMEAIFNITYDKNVFFEQFLKLKSSANIFFFY